MEYRASLVLDERICENYTKTLSGIYLWIGVVIVLLRTYPPGSQIVTDHVGQREKIVPGRGHVPVLDQREVQMSIEGLFHRDDVLQTGDGRHADLLPELFDVCQRHDGGSVRDLYITIRFRVYMDDDFYSPIANEK